MLTAVIQVIEDLHGLWGGILMMVVACAASVLMLYVWVCLIFGCI